MAYATHDCHRSSDRQSRTNMSTDSLFGEWPADNFLSLPTPDRVSLAGLYGLHPETIGGWLCQEIELLPVLRHLEGLFLKSSCASASALGCLGRGQRQENPKR